MYCAFEDTSLGSFGIIYFEFTIFLYETIYTKKHSNEVLSVIHKK